MSNPSFEIPAEFRDFADKSVDQARNAFGTILNGAVKTSEQFRNSASTVQSTLHAAMLKSLDHAKTNADTTFDYAQRVVRAKDVREAFEIQSEFVKTQFAALQAQAKEYGALAQNAAH
ncbi:MULTISPECIES: phasin [unclassified Methylobacterium]|uniref:phasin n=1 Tax=unclassified Methylobacterium TaxID=2615210 RepID=UPI000D753AC6|nr:phasin [Methylobacterium sp. B4]PXW63840.1 phasin [Methylobacterium sp. B4]